MRKVESFRLRRMRGDGSDIGTAAQNYYNSGGGAIGTAGFEATISSLGNCLEATFPLLTKKFTIQDRDIIEIKMQIEGISSEQTVFAGFVVRVGARGLANIKLIGMLERLDQIPTVTREVPQGDVMQQVKRCIEDSLSQLGSAVLYNAGLFPDCGIVSPAFRPNRESLKTTLVRLCAIANYKIIVGADRVLRLAQPFGVFDVRGNGVFLPKDNDGSEFVTAVDWLIDGNEGLTYRSVAPMTADQQRDGIGVVTVATTDSVPKLLEVQLGAPFYGNSDVSVLSYATKRVTTSGSYELTPLSPGPSSGNATPQTTADFLAINAAMRDNDQNSGLLIKSSNSVQFDVLFSAVARVAFFKYSIRAFGFAPSTWRMAIGQDGALVDPVPEVTSTGSEKILTGTVFASNVPYLKQPTIRITAVGGFELVELRAYAINTVLLDKLATFYYRLPVVDSGDHTANGYYGVTSEIITLRPDGSVLQAKVDAVKYLVKTGTIARTVYQIGTLEPPDQAAYRYLVQNSDAKTLLSSATLTKGN